MKRQTLIYSVAKFYLNLGQWMIKISNQISPLPTKDYIERNCNTKEVESVQELRGILDDMGLHNIPIVEIGQPVKEPEAKPLTKAEIDKLFLH